MKQINKVHIKYGQNLKKPVVSNSGSLSINELFSGTIQGEGRYIGTPSIFLRLHGCMNSCNFCDSEDALKYGERYSFNELFEIMHNSGLIDLLWIGHHLVITGGSPLLQQSYLVVFIQDFINKFKFKPFIEVENECRIPATTEFKLLVDCWNNSPKLNNSKQPISDLTEAIKSVSNQKESYFKFVIKSTNDWDEIVDKFLKTKLIKPSQIYLMPMGSTREELEKTTEVCLGLAVKHGIKYTPRLHITLWNGKKSV